MKYHNITKDDMLNGDGLRVVLWVSGCEHRCEGCHNPVTWDAECGIDFDDSAKKELFSSLDHSYISGITFSGGDPLHPKNIEDITQLVKEIKNKFPKKNIWLYTGYDYEDISYLDIMNYIDVLVDGKFVESKKDLKLHWRGSSNQRVIDVKNTLKSGNIVIYTE